MKGAEIDANNSHCLRIKKGGRGWMVVSTKIFCAAIVFEVFYQSVAGSRVLIGHALESSRKFRSKNDGFLKSNSTQGRLNRSIFKGQNDVWLQDDLLVFTVFGWSCDEQYCGLLLVRIVLAGLGRTAERTIGDHNQDVHHTQNDTNTTS